MAKPGSILYYDNIAALEHLSYEELGRLFLAILQYGQDGTLPQFTGMLAMAWAFLRPKLDRDEERYQQSVARSSYAAFCREIKKRGLPKVPKEVWSNMSIDERQQLLSPDVDGYPTADPTATATTNTNISISASASASTIPPAVADILAHGRISLSPFEIDTLQSKMGADDLEIYLVRLSHYISNYGEPAQSHYLTILGWWDDAQRNRL